MTKVNKGNDPLLASAKVLLLLILVLESNCCAFVDQLGALDASDLSGIEICLSFYV